MENNYSISVRTEDTGDQPFPFALVTKPKDTICVRNAEYGYVAFTLDAPGKQLNETGVKGGLNTAGLSCDKQTLIDSVYPNRTAGLDNIDASLICQWALEGFGSVADLKEGLKKVNFVATQNHDFQNGHWVMRDARGHGVVLEFQDGVLTLFDDNNDGGATGFGIMTNEPRFLWQTEAIRHLQWKMKRARAAVAMPGTWYPDDRFQRLYLVKSSMPTPRSYTEAISQAVHTLNTVTVPAGMQIGTDSGSVEGNNDRTHWAVVYDHATPTVYWRTQANQNLQRIRLRDARLEVGEIEGRLQTDNPRLPFFSDAAGCVSYAGRVPPSSMCKRI